MHIRQAAALTGLTPRAIRYYEQTGLIIPSTRTENGYRVYTIEEVERLHWIAALRQWGIPVESVSVILESLHSRELFLQAVNEARQQLYEQWLTASRSLRSLDRGIASWQNRLSMPSLNEVSEAALELQHHNATRAAWSDRLGWNEIAIQAGEAAPLQALPTDYSETRYQAQLQEITDWLDPLPGEAGADLGAGSGNLTRLLCQSGAVVTAVDQSSSMLALLESALPGTETRLGNLLALPLPDRSCHFAASSFVLQHLEQAERRLALKEMNRILLPGGRLALTSPLEESELLELGKWLRELDFEVFKCSNGMVLAVSS